MSFRAPLHSKSALVRRLGLLRQARWRREEIGEIIVKGREQIENIIQTTENRKFNHLLVSNKHADYGFLESFRKRCRVIHKVDPALLYEIVYQSRPVAKADFQKGATTSSADLLTDPSVSDSLMLASMSMPQFVMPSSMKLVLCLDGMVFPENVGALVRTAASMGGVDAIVATTGTCDFHGWKVLEASRGLGFDIPKFQIGDKLPHFVSKHGLVPFIGNPSGTEIVPPVFQEGKIVVLGNEKHGLSSTTLSLPNSVHVRIPTSEYMPSLNAAVAGGILLQLAAAS